MTNDLTKEIKDLKNRISELEKMLASALKPLQDVRKTAESYLKITSLILEHGGLTPDMMLPEIKDHISKEIVRALIERKNQNISQITELVRSKRGTASRRIIRERLKELEEKEIIVKQQKGKLYVYNITDKVLKKWSQMLGFNI